MLAELCQSLSPKAQLGDVPRAACGGQGDRPGLSQRCSGGCRDEGRAEQRDRGSSARSLCHLWALPVEELEEFSWDGAEQPQGSATGRRRQHKGPLVFGSRAK